MSVGVQRVLTWEPQLLLDAAERLASARDEIEQTGAALSDVQARLPQAWQGQAGRAALEALGDLAHADLDLSEALEMMKRVLAAAADALAAARTSVKNASDLADEHGLIMGDDGRVPPPPPIMMWAGADEVARWSAQRQHRLRAEAGRGHRAHRPCRAGCCGGG